MSQTSQSRPAAIETEAESILRNLHALRDQIVIAWSERAVILDAGERATLREEIHQTCELLTDLTRSG